MFKKPTNPIYSYITDFSASEITARKPRIILKCLFCYFLMIATGIITAFSSKTLYNSISLISLIAIFTVICLTASNKKISLISAIVLSLSSGAIISSVIKELDYRIPGLIPVLIAPIIMSYLTNYIIFLISDAKLEFRFKNLLFISVLNIIIFQLMAFLLSLLSHDYLYYIYFDGLWALITSIPIIFMSNYIFFFHFKESDDLIKRNLSRTYENYLIYGIIFSFVAIYFQIVILIRDFLTFIFDKRLDNK